MSARTSHALQIPEILCEVLEHFEFDLRTLFSACLVNKAWAEQGLNILWRSHLREGLERLERLSDRRRQFYANKIRSLRMDEKPIQNQDCLDTLNFPRLRTLEVCLGDVHYWNSSRCLVPSLEVFHLYAIGSRVEDYLRQLPECCPNLRELRVSYLGEKLDFDRFEDYLKKLSKLRSVDLDGLSDSTMTDEVLVHLASLPLCELRMCKLITSEIVDLAYKRLGSGNVFSKVTQVDFIMKWHAAAMLLPTLTTLKRLHIHLVSGDMDRGAFHAIGTLKELRDFKLTSGRIDNPLSREEILAIGKLHKLRNLTISSTLILDDSVTDDDMVSFLSSFPEAESININSFYTSIIPSSATIALATTSTRLWSYMISATLDLGFVGTSATPLFPELKAMAFPRLYCSDAPTEW